MALPFPTSPAPAALPVRPARPHLVVIEGGADAVRLHRGARASARTYALRRLLVLAIVAAIVVGAYGTWRSSSSDAVAPPEVSASYSVAPGDTLWSIVERLGLEGDRQEIVARLGEVNGGTVIRPGDRLVIPADVTAG